MSPSSRWCVALHFKLINDAKSLPQELTQIHKYLVLFPSDRLGVRLLVTSMFLVDCIATCNACAMVSAPHLGLGCSGSC